jgi:hypothetical protein
MAVWHSRSFRTVMEMWFLKKMNVVNWEQWLRTGSKAVNWGVPEPTVSKSRVFRVSATLSRRTWMGSECK